MTFSRDACILPVRLVERIPTNLERDNFMQSLAFLWCELQAAQQCLRETFVESRVPAKAGMVLSLLRRRRIYEPIKSVFSADCRGWHGVNCAGQRLS
jgi:hypothetical protein